MSLAHPILISRPGTQSDLARVSVPSAARKTVSNRDDSTHSHAIRSVTLHIEAGPHRGPRIKLPANASVRIGRSRGVELRMGGDTEMSREHTQIDVSPDEIRLFDLGSLNGTYVNWKRVGTAALQDGDVVEIGLTRLRVHVERA
jgi:pSer/pThr/pTyr-binding forkhead associated (FHA) protein